MSDVRDLLPESAHPYVATIQGDDAVRANLAAVNAIEAVANADDVDETTIEFFLSFIADETTLTKTAARNKYGELQSERYAAVFEAASMTVVESETDDDPDMLEVTGFVDGVPFRLFGEFSAVENGYPEVKSQLSKVVVSNGLEVDLPRSAEWHAMFDAWLASCRERDAIHVTDEPSTRNAHAIVERFLGRIGGLTDNLDVWNDPGHQQAYQLYVPTSGGEPEGDLVFCRFGSLEYAAGSRAEVAEDARPAEDVLVHRGYVTRRTREGGEFDALPKDCRDRVFAMSLDKLTSEGLVDPENVRHEPEV